MGMQASSCSRVPSEIKEEYYLCCRRSPYSNCTLCSSSTPRSMVHQSRSTGSRPPRHLVLHMDVNKTIIMSDKVSGKTPEAVVNEVISDVSWGVELDGRWKLSSSEPQTLRPAPSTPGGKELSSYTEWLEKTYPGSGNKKRRMQLAAAFTSPGEPGEHFKRHAEKLAAQLKNPDGSRVFIITSFFELLVHLKREQRSFTVCFRSFGEDLLSVLEEFNSFCEGRHPRYPKVRMDGSDGQTDYRVCYNDPSKCGTFHREDACTSLVMGTFEQPGEGEYKDAKDRSLMFYKSEISGARLIVGLHAVHDYMERICSTPGTICLRDFHQYWKRKGQTSAGGKVLFVEQDDIRTCVQHQIFFDDNIRFEDAFIVHPIVYTDPARHLWVSPLLRTHLCRATPWESIGDPQWFVKQVQRLEHGFERKLLAKQRLQRFFKLMRTSRYKLMEIRLNRERHKPTRQSVLYDPWEGMRKRDREISVGVDDDDNTDDAY